MSENLPLSSDRSGFADIDCPACRGIGETSVPSWDRTCKSDTGRNLRCRRCRGAGLL